MGWAAADRGGPADLVTEAVPAPQLSQAEPSVLIPAGASVAHLRPGHPSPEGTSHCRGSWGWEEPSSSTAEGI